MSTLKILACQIDIGSVVTAAQRDQHIQEIAQKIRHQLSLNPHDLVVLPELSTIDYSRDSFDNLKEIAEPLDGPSFEVFSALAQEFNVTILYGMPRLERGKFYISQIAVNGKGALIGYFDKLHIAQYGASMEKEYFDKGNHLFTFKVKGVTLAPIICYDIRIPELSRSLVVDHDVQMILHCGAYARDESFYSWHHFSVSRAIENQVFFLSLNRAGKNYGNSLFCAPWVDENSPGFTFPQKDELLKTLEVDISRINDIRQKYTFLADRFDDYSALELRGE